MAGIRQITQRRKAVGNIRRITHTMEMISTARYKSYHEKWLNVAEFQDALAQAAFLLVTPPEPLDHPLLKENSAGRTAVLAIGSARGLCGSYNTFIYKLIEEHIYRAKSLSQKLDIYVPQGRLVQLLNYRGIQPTKIYNIDEIPSDTQLNEIAEEFIGQYTKGLIDYFSVVYIRFYSATSQQAQTLNIMPLTELIDDLTTRSKVIWPWDLTFENFYLSPSADKVIEGLAKMMIRSAIKSCFMDAALSEHIARMVAMRNATENAEEMIKELTAEYNRARQTQITTELLDIIGGSGVLQ